MSSIKVKVERKYETGDKKDVICRRDIPTEDKLNALKQHITQNFKINNFKLTFIDTDNDPITIICESDLNQALDIAHKSENKTVKIFVEKIIIRDLTGPKLEPNTNTNTNQQ
eukprot:522984_1